MTLSPSESLAHMGVCTASLMQYLHKTVLYNSVDGILPIFYGLKMWFEHTKHPKYPHHYRTHLPVMLKNIAVGYVPLI